MRHLLVVPAALFILIVVLACKGSSVGSSCAAGTMKCTSSTGALYCNAGKFAAMNCGGPKGCDDSGKGVACDNTVASANDVCDEEKEYACTPDKKSRLECKANVFAVASVCGGEKGCYWTGNSIRCDTDAATAGDVCDTEDDVACSIDKRFALKCTGGKYTPFDTCKGDDGCKIDASHVRCDTTLGDVGDPCTGDEPTCESGKRNLLVCQGNKYAVKDSCDPACSFVKSAGKVDFSCP